MKKRESVIICPLLCISLLLTALASPLAVSVGVSAASNTAAEAGTEAEAAAPELILSKCYLIESDNYESIADGYFQAVLLSEESAGKFPAGKTSRSFPISPGSTSQNTESQTKTGRRQPLRAGSFRCARTTKL